jgi:hypothetical protein
MWKRLQTFTLKSNKTRLKPLSQSIWQPPLRHPVSYQPPTHRRTLVFPVCVFIIGEDSFVITSLQFSFFQKRSEFDSVIPWHDTEHRNEKKRKHGSWYLVATLTPWVWTQVHAGVVTICSDQPVCDRCVVFNFVARWKEGFVSMFNRTFTRLLMMGVFSRDCFGVLWGMRESAVSDSGRPKFMYLCSVLCVILYKQSL